jgi:hypothetical protein
MDLNLREFPYCCEVCRTPWVGRTLGSQAPLPDEQVRYCHTCSEITRWKLVGPKGRDIRRSRGLGTSAVFEPRPCGLIRE